MGNGAIGFQNIANAASHVEEGLSIEPERALIQGTTNLSGVKVKLLQIRMIQV